MKIILDGMGGDLAPVETVKGAVKASLETEHDICIVGREDEIKTELSKYKYNDEQITIVNADEVVTNEDSPVKAVRRKPNSSLVVGLSLVKGGSGDVFVSAGNTGAIIVASRMILGKIEGIDRPSLASIYPISEKGQPSLLIDAGASAESKPHNLLQQAAMGIIYMDKVLGKDDPSVGLVNLGVEANKGNTLTKEAYKLLSESGLNFVGNVEAREIPRDACDVIVCDGFTGNIILKLTEGLAMNIFKLLKKKFMESLSAKIGAMFLKNKIKSMVSDFDYSQYGGAPVLGVKGPVIKMHGASDAEAVKNTILNAVPFAENKVIDLIEKEMYDLEEIIDTKEYTV